MHYKNPVSMAVSSACLIVAGSAQADPDTIASLCGTTVETSDSLYNCGSETLTEDCSIKVAPGNNFSIAYCNVDAGGYALSIKAGADARVNILDSRVTNAALSIKGDLDASLRMDNTPVINASGIEIKFKGGDPDFVNCLNQNVIDIFDPDLVANGPEGEVSIKTDCGGIRILDNNFGHNKIAATKSVEVKAKRGHVFISGDNMSIAAPVYNALGGSIELSAGGEGNVSAHCVNMESGSIKISSDGNLGFVGCY